MDTITLRELNQLIKTLKELGADFDKPINLVNAIGPKAEQYGIGRADVNIDNEATFFISKFK